jgi:hypothetical protein
MDGAQLMCVPSIAAMESSKNDENLVLLDISVGRE